MARIPQSINQLACEPDSTLEGQKAAEDSGNRSRKKRTSTEKGALGGAREATQREHVHAQDHQATTQESRTYLLRRSAQRLARTSEAAKHGAKATGYRAIRSSGGR